MTDIYLGCFVFGILFTVVSLLMGFHQGGNGVHGNIGSHGASLGGHSAPAGGMPAAGFHGAGPGIDGLHHPGPGKGAGPGAGFFNFNGLVMFLTFFGAIGYALSRGGAHAIVFPAVAATGAGLVGATAVYLFLNKVLLRSETVMDPADYYMPGTQARVTSRVRSGGTGEIVYAQGGSRKTLGARAVDGSELPRGAEVVVIRVDRGIAYVKALDGPDMGMPAGFDGTSASV